MTNAGWDDLRLFLHVATEGGLTGAASRTGLSAPTIGRRMQSLERITGRTLFIRSQQGYRLAPDGETLLTHVRTMQRSADSISDWRGQAFALPLVSIGADAWLAGLITENLKEIRGSDDPWRLCCKSLHAGIDMAHRETDVGILARQPQTGNLAARRSVAVTYAIYKVSTLAEVADLPWISIGTESAHAPPDKWVFQNHEHDIQTWTNSADLVLPLILGGSGRGLLPCFVGDARADLVRDGDIIAELTAPLWIVAHDDDRHKPEVRRVIDRLAAFLKQREAIFLGDRRERSNTDLHGG